MSDVVDFIIKTVTSRFAGPVCLAIALAFFLLALGQCSLKTAQTERAEQAEKRSAAARASLATCQANTSTLENAIADQSERITAASEESARRVAAAERGLSEAMKGRAKAEATAARLLNTPPVGIDACARAVSAFDTVKRTLP